MNILCTICSDVLNQAESIYVTKCGHIFHLNCLSQWISRSKSCPQCRNKVTERCMFRMYPTISNENAGPTETVQTVQTKLDDAQLEIRQQKADLNAAKEKLKKNEEVMKEFEKTVKRVEEKLVSKMSAISALTEQINYLKVENKLVNKLKEENDGMKKKLHTLNGLQVVLNSVSDDVESMLQGYPDVKTIALFATALKRALLESEKKKNEYRDRLHAAKQHIATEENKNADMHAKIVQLEDKLASTERLLQDYKNKPPSVVPSTSKHKSSPNKRTSSDDESATSKPKRQRKNSKDEVPSISGTYETTGKAGTSGRSDKDVAEVEISGNTTINKMVSEIEDSQSPYLVLKQGGLALRVANRHRHADRDKAAEFTTLPISRSKENHSIFSSNRDRDLIILPNSETDRLTDISYDGLGGHSKLDVFPKSRPVLKNCIPKLTAKHKLKRPVVSGSQDITKMFEKIVDK